MFTSPFTKLAAAAVVLFGLAAPALAGPPLICFPFDAGDATLLAWGTGPNWNNPSRAYDTSALVADTLRLLVPGAPVLARMENMRRAAIYATADPALSERLLKAVIDRALTPSGPRDQMAWFDAGYMVETFKQAGPIRRQAGATGASWAAVEATLASIDGYAFVQKSFAMREPTPEMEFAASLMTSGPVSAAHRDRARQGAARGSLLERNLDGK